MLNSKFIETIFEKIQDRNIFYNFFPQPTAPSYGLHKIGLALKEVRDENYNSHI